MNTLDQNGIELHPQSHHVWYGNVQTPSSQREPSSRLNLFSSMQESESLQISANLSINQLNTNQLNTDRLNQNLKVSVRIHNPTQQERTLSSNPSWLITSFKIYCVPQTTPQGSLNIQGQRAQLVHSTASLSSSLSSSFTFGPSLTLSQVQQWSPIG